MSSIPGNQAIYVCGEQHQPHTLENPSLRDLIISSLAVYWSIRTHPLANTLDPRSESPDIYQTIARSHVFVFIYSKETIEDSFYLNQYGIAKAYGVPVVGIRMPSYILPNPLPEQYYFTELVDYSAETRGEPRVQERRNTNKKNKMLTDVLIHDFRNAMVYATDFHKSCIERLLHKVNSSYNKSEKEKRFFAALNNTTSNPNGNEVRENSMGWKFQAGIPKCPKCGFLAKRTATPTLQRASSTGSLLRKSNAFENSEPAANASVKRAALHPSTIQISSPYLARSPLKTRMRIQASCSDVGWGQNQKEKKPVEPFRGKLQTRTTTITGSEKAPALDHENASKLPLQTPNKDESSRGVLRKQTRISNSWTEKLRNKLRRQSSLPIVPTTYLLTTPDGLQTTMHFVKYPPEKKEPASPKGKDMAGIFSEDEEGEIHISRVPSPDAPSV